MFNILIALVFHFPLIPLHRPETICTSSDDDFSEYRYDEQIPYCQRNVHKELKSEIYDDYGVTKVFRHDYTIDHITPLSIGGTNHKDNLWPEHRSIHDRRFPIELDLYTAVKAGVLDQKTAVRIILNNKFDDRILNKPTYKSYGSLKNYLCQREKICASNSQKL